MARVLWLGDAGCHTGFGRVTHSIGDRLVLNHGHDVHVLAVNFDGDAGAWPTPMKLYRASKLESSDIYGQRRFIELLAEVMPDVVVTLFDPFVSMKLLFRNAHDQNFVMARARPILAYTPIDGINQPTNWQKVPGPDVYGKLSPVDDHSPKPSYHPVAMSKFGQSILGEVPLVYHGIDIETYRPVSGTAPMTTTTGLVVKSKKDAKRVLGIDPDSFLVLRVDRNSARKNYADTWKALLPVMHRHPDVTAWFHCRGQGDGLELPELFSRDPATAQRFRTPANFNTGRGWAEQDMAILYNAADLFVSTSWGEGFGLTLGEAAATGIPIIAQNISSIPEVVGPGGILLEPERLTTVFAGQDQWLPNVESFTDAIEHLYSSRGARRDLGTAGRNHVATSFSWDVEAAKFSDLINGLAQWTTGSPEGSDA